jgi:hypothetical protein
VANDRQAVDAVEEEGQWRKETVSFDAGYGNERMQAYLFLPKDGQSTPSLADNLGLSSKPTKLWPYTRATASATKNRTGGSRPSKAAQNQFLVRLYGYKTPIALWTGTASAATTTGAPRVDVRNPAF